MSSKAVRAAICEDVVLFTYTEAGSRFRLLRAGQYLRCEQETKPDLWVPVQFDRIYAIQALEALLVSHLVLKNENAILKKRALQALTDSVRSRGVGC